MEGQFSGLEDLTGAARCSEMREAVTSEEKSRVTTLVCTSCRFPGQGNASSRPGLQLAEATRSAAVAQGIDFRKVGCLGDCKRGLSAAILCDGCWSYVFGELSAESASELVVGARLFAGSTDGFMPYCACPESLKCGLISRVPAFANLKDLPG